VPTSDQGSSQEMPRPTRAVEPRKKIGQYWL
jgi:hypothetical protein